MFTKHILGILKQTGITLSKLHFPSFLAGLPNVWMVMSENKTDLIELWLECRLYLNPQSRSLYFWTMQQELHILFTPMNKPHRRDFCIEWGRRLYEILSEVHSNAQSLWLMFYKIWNYYIWFFSKLLNACTM